MTAIPCAYRIWNGFQLRIAAAVLLLFSIPAQRHRLIALMDLANRIATTAPAFRVPYSWHTLSELAGADGQGLSPTGSALAYVQNLSPGSST